MQLINAGGVDGLTLSDRVAKRSFGAESATIISNTGLKLRQGARKLQAAEFVSTTLRNADNIVDRLSSATNPMDRKTLTDELTKSFQLLKN